MRDVHDTHDRGVILYKQIGRHGRLDAIIVVCGEEVIVLEPLEAVQLALNIVELNMRHDPVNPDGSDELDVPIPHEHDELMQNAAPWVPSPAQRARAIELVDTRVHGGDWQTNLLMFARNAAREQSQVECYWALAEYAAQALHRHGPEVAKQTVRYDLTLNREAALEEVENSDD